MAYHKWVYVLLVHSVHMSKISQALCSRTSDLKYNTRRFVEKPLTFGSCVIIKNKYMLQEIIIYCHVFQTLSQSEAVCVTSQRSVVLSEC